MNDTDDESAARQTPRRQRRDKDQAISRSEPGHRAVDAGDERKARFRFYLIDSGWNSAAARVVRENLGMITKFQNNDPLYVLDETQSTALLRRYPHLIGKDPILIARDLAARGASGADEYHGFHLNLGLVRDPVSAVEGLRQFLGFLATHRHSTDIEDAVRQQLHREGWQGAIEVLRLGGEAVAG